MVLRSEGVGGGGANIYNEQPNAEPSMLRAPEPTVAGDESIGAIIEQSIGAFVTKLRLLAVAETNLAPPVQGVKDKWVAQAKEKIGFGSGQKPPDYFEMNRRITSAYAEMYLSKPDVFKWAGMAAFASKEVGDGMRSAEALSESDIPYVPFAPGLDISGTELEQSLAQGNLGVYADIYWQHLAYQGGGIKELQKAYNAGELNRVAFEAWQKIDRGSREHNQDLIWQGNKELLEYEQRTVLQTAVYDHNRKLWREMSSAPVSWFQKIESPIPGDSRNFNSYVDGGDIGNFNDRWKWISESMLPAWQRLDGNRLEAGRLLRQLEVK